MLNMRARKRNSIGYYLLLSLEKAVDGCVRIDDFVNHPNRYIYGDPESLKKSSLSQAVKRLREDGLIEQLEYDNEVILKLTSGGLEFLGNDLEEWDGQWRIVIWDIPEQRRLVRDLFRRNLKKLGFAPLQKSVWISKRKVYDKLINYVKELGIEDWVTVIEASKLSINQ